MFFKRIVILSIISMFIHASSTAAPIGDQTAGPAAVIDYSAAAEFILPTGVFADITQNPSPGTLVNVTDGASLETCSTGGGNHSILCMYNGSQWISVGVAHLHPNKSILDSTTAAYTTGQQTILNTLNARPTPFSADNCATVTGMVQGDLCFEY